jgi:cation diffusion facilitator CzcD-associated flavoprotein CzcO
MTESVDVLIVGAGLSGIGAAYRLQTQARGKSYAVLEARDAIGGTWDLFRYPGVRADSDMFTFGYPFEPWTDRRLMAEGSAIRSYIAGTATKHGIDQHIRFQHTVVRAAWSSADARWTVTAEAGPDRAPVTYFCAFLYLCTGYYSYSSGHVVDFPGQEEFRGVIAHPQFWPEDLDYRGKRVVVVGSGATAVTVVPAMAQTAAHVTMLQRSPSYYACMPATDPIADWLRARLPAGVAHRVNRAKNVTVVTLLLMAGRRWPAWMSNLLRGQIERELKGSFPMDPHFVPSYEPLDERIGIVPDGDLFTALNDGRASMVTDHIDTFTATGIRLRSGAEIEADVIVTATGLKAVSFGEIAVTVDGVPADPSQSLIYKGMMFSGIPNLVWSIGYTDAAWTLRADLTAQYVARLLNYMDRRGHTVCTPYVGDGDPALESLRPMVGTKAGYVRRATGIWPKRSARRPWHLSQNYFVDLPTIRYGRVKNTALRFGRAPARPAARRQLAATR